MIVPTWGFIVSAARHGQHRKLHHIGSCKLKPGVDYKVWEHYGENLPGDAEIDSRCKWCFKDQIMMEDQGLEGASDDGDDDGEISSRRRDRETPPGARRTTTTRFVVDERKINNTAAVSLLCMYVVYIVFGSNTNVCM